jgi:hypothetical protein
MLILNMSIIILNMRMEQLRAAFPGCQDCFQKPQYLIAITVHDDDHDDHDDDDHDDDDDYGSIGVLQDGSGGQQVCFLMGYKNFRVPESLDSDMSRKISKVTVLLLELLVSNTDRAHSEGSA